MFQAVIEERMHNRPVFAVDRVFPDEAQRERDTSLVLESVSASLERQAEELRKSVEQPEGLDPERSFGALGSADDVRRHMDEWLRHELARQPSLGGIFGPGPIFTGDVTYAPPYNDDWQAGSGFALGATADGSLSTIGDVGFSVAGVNVYLASNVSSVVSATIKPEGTYKYNWVALENLPSLQTRGGLGISVRVGDADALSREITLWRQSGAIAYMGRTGEGLLMNAVSAPDGGFPVSLAPVQIDMQPGQQYLFSLWCWQFGFYPVGAAFIAFMNATMPAVKLAVSPASVVA